MEIGFTFHTTLRDAVGRKTVTRTFDAGTTLGEALDCIAADHESLGSLLFRSDGRLRSHVTITVNGEPLVENERYQRGLEGGETVVLAPGIAGGISENGTGTK